MGEVGTGVFAAALAIAVVNPEWCAPPSHQSTAERCDEAGQSVNAGLFVMPPEPAVLGKPEEVEQQPAQCLGMSHRLELRCVWVEPCPKSFIIPRLWIDEFAVVGKMGHWHIEHTIDAWQTTGEEAVDQGDAGVLLTHALGHKDFVTGIILAQHTRLDESLDRCHELRCLNGREHVSWNRACTVGSGNRGDFYDVGGEAEQF